MTNENRQYFKVARQVLRAAGVSNYEIDRGFARARSVARRERLKRECVENDRKMQRSIDLAIIDASMQLRRDELLEGASNEYQRGWKDGELFQAEVQSAIHHII